MNSTGSIECTTPMGFGDTAKAEAVESVILGRAERNIKHRDGSRVDMECNRDEAVRSKAIAERKFHAKDIAGAKKFAIKAQTLDPGLEGIGQMLATLEVYEAAEEKVNGEADWYCVLGITPLADEDTVRKQYRKLALTLHPDKNKSVGSEGAFKLISEAWSLLSDRTRRAAFDQRRSGGGFQMKAAPPRSNAPPPPAANGFYDSAKTNVPISRTNKSTSRVNHTFWTVCLQCKVQYEYLRKYLNHNLLCPNCRQPFIATETAPPISKGSGSSSRHKSSHQTKHANHLASNKTKASGVHPGSYRNSHAHNDFQWTPFSGASDLSAASQVASVVQQTYERVRKEREEAQAKKRREKSLKRKNLAYEKMGIAARSDHSDVIKKRRGIYNADIDSLNHMSLRTGVSTNHKSMQINGTGKPENLRELSDAELGDILAEKARKEIQNRFSGQEWANAVNNKPQKEKPLVIARVKEKESKNMGLNVNLCNQGSRSSRNLGDWVEPHERSVYNSSRQTLFPLSVDVPDPDFFNFDNDRTERSFAEHQVWAAYDNTDGMPRHYASIHRILSQKPFKMQIRWLNSNTNSELSPLNWVRSGFTKTCGDFRLGRSEIYDSLHAFSHKVRWTKRSQGVIHIFPREGDVWALYRNWSPDWNELTGGDVIHKYEMVEVLDGYDEEVGVVVIPLVKVAGFKTVFHHHLDPKQVRRIPREQMFRFSHQVPSRFLSGKEAPNAPKGCWELDPAATPVELLQVIASVNEEDYLASKASDWEEPVHDNDEKASIKRIREGSEEGRENPLRPEDNGLKEVIVLEGSEKTK